MVIQKTHEAKAALFGIGASNIVTAHLPQTVGSKITNLSFWDYLADAIAKYEFPGNGQGMIEIPAGKGAVSSGVALKAGIPLDGYHVVKHREGPMLVVDRKFAVAVENLRCVVYTQAAYTADPDCTPEEKERQRDKKYVLVAVLADAGPKAPLYPFRFCHNLAGGNNAFKPENGYTLERAIKDAQEIVGYWNNYAVVADRV